MDKKIIINKLQKEIEEIKDIIRQRAQVYDEGVSDDEIELLSSIDFDKSYIVRYFDYEALENHNFDVGFIHGLKKAIRILSK